MRSVYERIAFIQRLSTFPGSLVPIGHGVSLSRPRFRCRLSKQLGMGANVVEDNQLFLFFNFVHE